MGAWSKDSFGNDTACDWAYDLQEADDIEFVRDTIQKILDSGTEYLEAPDAEEAIAAVEVIARLKGNFGLQDSYSQKVDDWVKAHPQQPSPELVAAATEALDRILRVPSELLELWQESKEFEAWKNSVLHLRSRAAK